MNAQDALFKVHRGITMEPREDKKSPFSTTLAMLDANDALIKQLTDKVDDMIKNTDAQLSESRLIRIQAKEAEARTRELRRQLVEKDSRIEQLLDMVKKIENRMSTLEATLHRPFSSN